MRVGVGVGEMKKNMAAKSAGWGGGRGNEKEDGGEECGLGWR